MASAHLSSSSLKLYDILVIGSLVSDISCTYTKRPGEKSSSEPRHGSSNPARITQCVGGVAHNIALSAHYLGQSVLLVSVVGSDSAGEFLLREVKEEGLSTAGIIKLESTKDFGEVRTGQYVGNYSHDKELIFGMADVGLMLHPDTQKHLIWETIILKTQPKVIVLDTTFSHATIDIITRLARHVGANVIVDPVSQPRAEDFAKSLTFREAQSASPQHRLDIITPNVEELAAVVRGAVNASLLSWENVHQKRAATKTAMLTTGTGLLSLVWPELSVTILNAACLLSFVPAILVTLGSRGCLLALRKEAPVRQQRHPEEKDVKLVDIPNESYSMFIDWLPAARFLNINEVVSVNGAGDSLVGALAAGLVAASRSHGLPFRGHRSELDNAMPLQTWKEIVNFGQRAAIATLRSDKAVGPELCELQGFLSNFAAN